MLNGRNRIEAYLEPLFGYACSLTREREEARDLVQECAARALKSPRAPADEPAYRSWLFRILRNAFIDQRRGCARFPEIPWTETESPAIDWRYLRRHEDRLLDRLTVRAGLRTLSTDHRELLTLIDFVGFGYAEAAAHLDVPVGTVMSRVSRARKALLAAVSPALGNGAARD